MSDIDVEELICQLSMRLRREVVRSLLGGNDTGCFSTEQYRQRWVERERARFGQSYLISCLELARQHLLSLPEMAREVKPDVWAAVAEFHLDSRYGDT